MEPRVSIVPATVGHAERIAEHLRDEDRAELVAAVGPRLAAEVVRESIERSMMARALLIDGEVAAIYGVAPSVLPEAGIVWMVTGTLVDDHPRLFWEQCKRRLTDVFERYEAVFNWVDARYSRSLNWLRHLGFTVDSEPDAYGFEQRPFHFICRRRDQQRGR